MTPDEGCRADPEPCPQVGDKLPAATLYEDSPANSVNTADLCKGKVVMFGVPGAFTPGCSQVGGPGHRSRSHRLSQTLLVFMHVLCFVFDIFELQKLP